MTVTRRRSVVGPAAVRVPASGAADSPGAAIECPQAPQKRNPSGSWAPQAGQVYASARPHRPQKRNPAGLSKAQSGHCIAAKSISPPGPLPCGPRY
jgi:hypothetical protein